MVVGASGEISIAGHLTFSLPLCVAYLLLMLNESINLDRNRTKALLRQLHELGDQGSDRLRCIFLHKVADPG
jgi:hypothetical protein